jgi:hypothetical protein
MWTEIGILLATIVLGTLTLLAVIHRTFLRASSPRDAIVTPEVYAICGALVGISTGMIWLVDNNGRVALEKGFLALACGACVGAVAGGVTREYYSKLSRGKVAIFLLSMAVLGGSVSAPIGWISGDVAATVAGNPNRAELCASRMLISILFGATIALLLAIQDLLKRWLESHDAAWQ